MAGRAGRRGFGYVRKLPSGRYQASYTGPDTQRHNAAETFQTKSDAEAWLDREQALVASGAWTSPAARKAARERQAALVKSRGFAAYATAWLASRHDLRPTTRASYETSLQHHLIPAFGPTPITDIDTEAVRAWFQGYGSRTPTARAHAFAVLKAILGQAEDDGLIVRNPARIKAGGRAPTKRDPQVLSLAELLALANAMPEKHRALTLLSGLCGLRFGEAAALRRADVDLSAGIVHVQHGVIRIRGQKSIGKPKTKAAVRTVAMPQLVVDAMREHTGRSIAGGRGGLVPRRGRQAPRTLRALRPDGPPREAGREDLREGGIRVLRGP